MNTMQVIEFDNGYTQSGMGMGMMSGLPHPMHIHGQQFQIIERVIREDRRKDYETVSKGLSMTAGRTWCWSCPAKKSPCSNASTTTKDCSSIIATTSNMRKWA